jgi:hypothetical protein
MKSAVMLLPRKPMPNMALMSQNLSADHLPNPRAELQSKLLAAGMRQKIKPGARIAITAGSRGIGGFLDLLNGICDAVRAFGGEPFLVPAMGSHGGATSQGQIEILRRLGVNDRSIDAPVQATMDTIPLGKARSGATAHLDAIAAQANGIIVLGRVKTHPENAEGIASGLLKMTTVGLGKQIGAQEAHSHGLWESVESVAELTLASGKIVFGVAVVENAFRKPLAIEVVPGTYAAFREVDTRLLKLAHQHLASIPTRDLDVLIVDELGKNVSGTGMDLNVIGSWRLKGGKPDPNYRRIVARSLTAESLGNGLGIGLADFTTRRFMNEYDAAATYINLLTATEPGAMNTREGPLPMALPSDRDAIEVALYSALVGTNPRICRIRNTSLLNEFWVSEPVLRELEQKRSISVLAPLTEPQFDENGALI